MSENGSLSPVYKGGSPASGPLVGIKVIDLGSFVAGAFAATLLGDFGAEVIKVEPLEGDPARGVGPFLRGEGRAFIGWNRNKRGVAVDLAKDSGREVIYDLVREADVVIENFRPGITERLKIDYATLREVNPRIIYCSSTAFGSKGPYRNRTAFDLILQAMGGVAMSNAVFAERVTLGAVLISDYSAALLGVGAINAALFHREKTGEGQLVETSLLQSVMTVQGPAYCFAQEVEEEPPAGAYPYRLFQTKDRPICVAALTPKAWKSLCEGVGMPEMADNPEYKTNADRVSHREELHALIEPIFEAKTAAEWEQLLAERGVPCGVVQNQAEFIEDPQVKEMEMNRLVDHTTVGPIKMSGVPVHFEKTPGDIQRSAPLLGEHTIEVLREHGFTDQRIDELATEGAIHQADTAGVR